MIFQNYIAILYFIVVSIGFGISLDYFFHFTQKFKEYLYKFFALLTIGFAFFMLMLFVVGMVRIPIYYPVFLILSLIIPAFMSIKNWSSKIIDRNITADFFQVITLIIIFAFFFVMLYGTFSYPWLEDDDPWSYAEGAKFVAIKHTYHTPSELHSYSQYLFPHSHCMITVIFGLLNQITPDLMFVMKFFICVFLLLGIMGFFLFVYNFTQHHIFAIVATAILAITPCFVGHFIYNYTLSVCLFCIFLFTLSLAMTFDNKYVILSGMILGSVLIAHPIAGVQAAVVMFIMLVFYFVREIVIDRSLSSSRLFPIIAVGLLGILFAMPFYGDLVISGQFQPFYHRAVGMGIVKLSTGNYYDTQDYVLKDFFDAPLQTHIDQQTGIGLFLFLLCILGLGLVIGKRNENMKLYAMLFCFYFFFLWIMSGSSWGISLQNIRWWSFFAIFIALFATSTIFAICSALQKSDILLSIFIVIICIGLAVTSAYPRFTVQTSQWIPGANWQSVDQLQSFVNLKELGYNKKIFPICGRTEKTNAFNQLTPTWENQTQIYFTKIINASTMNSTDILYNAEDALIADKYQYVLIDVECVNKFGANITTEIADYFGSNIWYRAEPDYSNNVFILFKRL